MKMNMEALRDFGLAFALAIMGLLLTTHTFLMLLNSLNPLLGFLIYSVIIFIVLSVFGMLGLVVFGVQIKHPSQVLGLMLITFAFFIVVSWESPYIQIATNGTADNISPIYFQSEDGATWFVWSELFKIINMTDAGIIRLFTYVFSPFVLALTGGFLLDKRAKIGI